MISIIHPSRGRAAMSLRTITKWFEMSSMDAQVELLVSIDSDEPERSFYEAYPNLIVNNNRSAIDAINNAAKVAKGDILMVVSDDTEPIQNWDSFIEDHAKNDSDWILKTQDGIQNYIITMPVMDRAYYNRTGYIYHPDFQHLFCDTYMTCVADITGRKITSNIMFKHNHYSVNGEAPDDLHKRNDATWKQGQETFIRLMRQFTPEERSRIKDPSMKNWLRNYGGIR